MRRLPLRAPGVPLIALALGLAGVLLTREAEAQPPHTAAVATGATITGFVYDSTARAMLADAMVQLVTVEGVPVSARTTYSDSLGAFTIRDVPGGSYLLGFFHPRLDSLTLDPAVRQLEVTGGSTVRVDLAIPSAARVTAAVCDAGRAQESTSAVMGIVRDARTRAPVVGAAVTVEWAEYTVSRIGFVRRVASLFGTTGSAGRFAVCDVPKPGTVVVRASRGADSTAMIEVPVGEDGFSRRDLYLGVARLVVVGDTVIGVDTVRGPRSLHLGAGRLTGTVATVNGGPLAGAHVGIADGPQTRSNERGQWTLTEVPMGTRILEVRSITYYPVRLPVDVITGAPPVHTALSTMSAVMDTVRVTASRVHDSNMRGFMERRQSGTGRYMTAAEIASRHYILASEIFQMMPGLQEMRNGVGDRFLTMRGMFGGRCSPTVFIDGHRMMQLSSDEINTYVNPDEIAGIEVYSGVNVHPHFQDGMNQCGSIVIWTKPGAAAYNRGPWLPRILGMIGVVAAGLAIGALLRSAF